MTKSTKVTVFAPTAILSKAEVVRETAHTVWLAGLGALSLAGDEGGKAFKALVKRGASLDAKNRKALSAIVKDVEARVEIVKEQMTDATTGTRAKLEHGASRIGSGVEQRVASVMHTLGVPTRGEIQMLTKKVDALTKSVEQKAKSARKATSRKAKAVAGATTSGTPQQ